MRLFRDAVLEDELHALSIRVQNMELVVANFEPTLKAQKAVHAAEIEITEKQKNAIISENEQLRTAVGELQGALQQQEVSADMRERGKRSGEVRKEAKETEDALLRQLITAAGQHPKVKEFIGSKPEYAGVFAVAQSDPRVAIRMLIKALNGGMI